ncbi:unnamed protein product [Protopolystoma xenopodis]|uniref:Uncharacterized protein n=1 Tax=Protopolystoma xenopodis TaxID=117903 RepID=A0A448X9U2_9PLAT|nr:unnamed protein product [Protopolystoma xenopodis]
MSAGHQHRVYVTSENDVSEIARRSDPNGLAGSTAVIEMHLPDPRKPKGYKLGVSVQACIIPLLMI